MSSESCTSFTPLLLFHISSDGSSTVPPELVRVQMGRSLAILLRISCWDSPRSSRSSSSLSEQDRWNYVGQNTEVKNNTCDLSTPVPARSDLNPQISSVDVRDAVMFVPVKLQRSRQRRLFLLLSFICCFFFQPQQANGSEAAQSCDITFSHSGDL